MEQDEGQKVPSFRDQVAETSPSPNLSFFTRLINSSASPRSDLELHPSAPHLGKDKADPPPKQDGSATGHKETAGDSTHVTLCLEWDIVFLGGNKEHVDHVPNLFEYSQTLSCNLTLQPTYSASEPN